MKPCLMAIAVFVFVFSSALAEDSETLFKEALQLARDLREVLKPVKDKASAEAAAPKLKGLDERFSALKKKRDDLASSPAEQKRLQAKYQAEFETVMKPLKPELERIEKLPDVKAQLIEGSVLVKRAYELSAELAQAKAELAKLQVFLIEQALQAYKVKTGEFPANLKLLTEGDKPYLDKTDLSDPWDKPYQYDPTKLNAMGKPHIWTVGPDKKVIGNWDEEKK